MSLDWRLASMTALTPLLVGCTCNSAKFTTSKSDSQLQQAVRDVFSAPMIPSQREVAVKAALSDGRINGVPLAASADFGEVYIPITNAECDLWGSFGSDGGLLVQFDDAGRVSEVHRVQAVSMIEVLDNDWFYENGDRFDRDFTLERIEWTQKD